MLSNDYILQEVRRRGYDDYLTEVIVAEVEKDNETYFIEGGNHWLYLLNHNEFSALKNVVIDSETNLLDSNYVGAVTIPIDHYLLRGQVSIIALTSLANPFTFIFQRITPIKRCSQIAA